MYMYVDNVGPIFNNRVTDGPAVTVVVNLIFFLNFYMYFYFVVLCLDNYVPNPLGIYRLNQRGFHIISRKLR